MKCGVIVLSKNVVNNEEIRALLDSFNECAREVNNLSKTMGNLSKAYVKINENIGVLRDTIDDIDNKEETLAFIENLNNSLPDVFSGIDMISKEMINHKDSIESIVEEHMESIKEIIKSNNEELLNSIQVQVSESIKCTNNKSKVIKRRLIK